MTEKEIEEICQKLRADLDLHGAKYDMGCFLMGYRDVLSDIDFQHFAGRITAEWMGWRALQIAQDILEP